MPRKPGKYAHITPHLPKYDGVEPERRDVVESVKTKILAPATRDTSDDKRLVESILEEMDADAKELYAIELTATGDKRYASEFARVYAELRKIKDLINTWLSDTNLLIEAYQILMVEQMEVEGITSMKLDNGQPITTFEEPYTQIADKEAFRLWCIENGLERSLTLHPGTASSLVKNLLIQGQPEPKGIKVWSKTTVRLGSE